jgi:hypothetical protein
MGVFPIIMNILQFWLIDSIVKASASEPVALDVESGDGYDEDREPLFRAPEDSENDGAVARHDIENPSPPRRSRSKSRSLSNDKPVVSDSGLSTPEEIKTTGSTTPAAAADRHEYPPSLSSSIASASTMESAQSVREATKLNKKRPTLSAIRVSSANKTPLGTEPVVAEHADEWGDSWEDSNDWADRVGEEDWTGRRLEHKRDIVRNTWQNSQEQVL